MPPPRHPLHGTPFAAKRVLADVERQTAEQPCPVRCLRLPLQAVIAGLETANRRIERVWLRNECLNETLFTSLRQARAVLAAWQRDYNCSSQRTSRYVVEEKRFCWAAPGNVGCLGWALALRARVRAAVLSRSARLKIQGPFSSGCVASITPRSTANRKVRGATPTMAAASPRLSQGSTASAASQYTGIR